MESSKLPIRQHAADIVEAVKSNDVVVVIGETGSGKTTQLSQILLDAGLASDGIIGVTQPRRVGAVTVARRVAEERGVELGDEVGYAVRFENRSSSSTKIKYLTDGTLLQECLEDPHLSRYQVIILDEAHERSLNTDILFGVIKKLLATQHTARSHPLKLLVTSATLDGQKFSQYFNNCPVFSVPGRCYPVEIIHSQDDHLNDYAAAAVDTALQIHINNPPGDILIFLTGQSEIEKAVSRLTQAVCSLPDGSASDLLVLPLYAALPPELQLRVFRPGQQGVRRCIVATNVAETSITVDGVVYVVDSGVMKLKSHNAATGMDSLDITPISRVQAAQRAGRAGRTQPGKCYRLYSRTYFERHMPDITPPEVCRSSLSGAVLGLKALQLPGLDVLTFDFLDPPEQSALCEALCQLYVLDAVAADGVITDLGRVMAGLPLDPALARALIEAHRLGCLDEVITVAAMLSAEHVFAAGKGSDGRASAANGLTNGAGNNNNGNYSSSDGNRESAAAAASRRLQQVAAECNGDHLMMLRIYQMWANEGFSRDFIHQYGLDSRGMNFARDIRKQLAAVAVFDKRIQQQQQYDRNPSSSDQQQQQQQQSDQHIDRKRRCWDEGKRSPPHPDQQRAPAAAVGYGSSSSSNQGRPLTTRPPNRGSSSSRSLATPEVMEKVRQALTIGFANKIARRLRLHNGYRTCNQKGALAQVHPGSSQLQSDGDGLLPEWLIYHEFVSTSRPFIRQVCPTRYEWVEPLLPKLYNVDVQRLSGGKLKAAAADAGQQQQQPGDAGAAAAAAAESAAQKLARRNDDVAVSAARQRYLQRKQAAAAAGKK